MEYGSAFASRCDRFTSSACQSVLSYSPCATVLNRRSKFAPVFAEVSMYSPWMLFANTPPLHWRSTERGPFCCRRLHIQGPSRRWKRFPEPTTSPTDDALFWRSPSQKSPSWSHQIPIWQHLSFTIRKCFLPASRQYTGPNPWYCSCPAVSQISRTTLYSHTTETPLPGYPAWQSSGCGKLG